MTKLIYEPDEDSFLLASSISPFCTNKKVLDMGCGMGYLALEAQKIALSVHCVDINEAAVNSCKVLGLDAITSDLFSEVSGKFDVILFNPPYLPLEQEEDEESALITSGGIEGHELLECFLAEAQHYLISNGCILVLVSSLTPFVEELFKNYSYSFTLLKEKKLFFETLKVYCLKITY